MYLSVGCSSEILIFVAAIFPSIFAAVADVLDVTVSLQSFYINVIFILAVFGSGERRGELIQNFIHRFISVFGFGFENHNFILTF